VCDCDAQEFSILTSNFRSAQFNTKQMHSDEASISVSDKVVSGKLVTDTDLNQ